MASFIPALQMKGLASGKREKKMREEGKMWSERKKERKKEIG